MWRKNKINVNKVFRELLSKVVIPNPNQYIVAYPHVDYKYKNKLWLIGSIKQTIHIFTPLIVVINFIYENRVY